MEYSIKISQKDASIIFHALGEIPLKNSLNLFNKLQQQIAEQDQENAVSLPSLDETRAA